MLPGLSEREFQELRFSVGKTTRERRPLSPVEVGERCAKAIDNGATPAQVTTELEMTDKSMVPKFLRIRNLIPDIRHLVSWGFSGDGALGFSVAAQVARMGENQQLGASEAVLKYQLTRNEMTSIIQLLERSKEPLEACVNRVVRRRPIVRTQHVVLGAITSADLTSRLRSLSQLQRDDMLHQILLKLFPTIKDFTAKLGPERFTIIGGRGVAETVATQPDLEQRVNRSLGVKLT